jgi:FkbM family methyltransferase
MSPAASAQTDVPTPPLVSVIIPTYNRIQLLREAVTSVLAQEGRGQLFDLEVIVVDDASSDGTPGIAQEFPCLRYLRFDINKGPSAARNAGIAASAGKYVAFLDDDDLWLPKRLERHLPILEQEKDIAVVYGHGHVMDLHGNLIIWPESGPSGRVFEEFLIRTDDFINIDTLLVRKDALARAGYFDETIETMEHYEFALRLAYYYPWRFVQGPVTHGRESKQGKYYRDVVSGLNERMLPLIIEKTLRLLPDSPESEQVRRRARTALCATIAGQQWWCGAGADQVRTFLLSKLRTHPWMAAEPAVQRQIRKLIRATAASSPDPLTAVTMLWKDLHGAGGSELRAPDYRWGTVLAEAAEGLREDGGAPFQAAALAWRGTFRRPSEWNRRLLQLIGNGLALLATRPAKALARACGIMKPEERWNLLLAELARSRDVFFVEVGAMDGIAFDPLYDSVNKYGWRGLLVEPLPDLFAQLGRTYDGCDGIILENVAIAESSGTITMTRVKPEAVAQGLVPSWAKGMSSLFEDRNGLAGHRISEEDFRKIRPHIVHEVVQCDRLENILHKHHVSKIDLLQIDVEGYDYHVLKQVDFSRFQPKVIRMEWCNLPPEEKQLSRNLLRRAGYHLVELEFDLIAWCRK